MVNTIDWQKWILTKSVEKSFLIDQPTTNNAIYRDSLTLNNYFCFQKFISMKIDFNLSIYLVLFVSIKHPCLCKNRDLHKTCAYVCRKIYKPLILNSIFGKLSSSLGLFFISKSTLPILWRSKICSQKNWYWAS